MAEDTIIQAPDVVVTASRVAQTVDDTLAAVTVITREDIEKRQPRDIQDLFKSVPSVSIVNNGGLGKTTTFALRGTETKHVLILIDGVRVGSATRGLTPLQHIPVEQIERIEIVRGARSHLYGSDAVGGVIQIFTRGGGNKTHTYGSFGYGSHNTMDANAGLSGTVDKTGYSLNLGKRRSNGFNSCGNGVDKPASGCRKLEPDDDRYDQTSASGHLSHDFENGFSLGTRGSFAEAANENDGNTSNETRSSQRVLGFNVGKDVTDFWDVKLTTARSWDLSDNYLDDTYVSTFDTIRDSATLQNDIVINDEHMLVVGGDYLHDKVKSSTNYAKTTRGNYGIFGQYLGEFGDHSVEASLRRDDNEQFGNHLTGGGAWGYSIRRNMELFASYATAFKAPTFNDLYYPTTGSATLKPEESKSYEIGLKGREKIGRWAVYGFLTNVKNQITYMGWNVPYENLDNARMTGFEAEGEVSWKNWDLAGNVSYVDPENRTGGSNRGNDLRRRPRWRGNLSVGHQIDDLHLGGDIHVVGQSYDDAANTRELKQYATLDLKSSYALTPDWDVEFSANNVTDRVYHTASFYNADGRNFFLKLRYSRTED
ncbi:MAG: TonB-dependent receptor [Rhodospirillales bacterium]|nr:TonB-dependent receptor [Rhodospirillales bacterium]